MYLGILRCLEVESSPNGCSLVALSRHSLAQRVYTLINSYQLRHQKPKIPLLHLDTNNLNLTATDLGVKVSLSEP
jgi:hypothetical protein